MVTYCIIVLFVDMNGNLLHIVLFVDTSGNLLHLCVSGQQ